MHRLMCFTFYPKAIQHNHPLDAGACCTALLETWLTKSPLPTWKLLIEALNSPIIDRGDIAADIQTLIREKP